MSMTSLERYTAVLEGKAADHLPRLPILMAFAAQHIRSNYGAFASDYRVLVESNLRCAEDFGMDQLSTISDPYRETQGFGARIEFVTDGVPRCAKPPLAETRDLKALAKPDPRTSERMLDRVRAVEAFKRAAGGQRSVLGWVEGPAAEAADLRGVENFLVDLAEEEDFAGELMDRCVEVGLEFAAAQVRAGAETIGVGDAICSQVSPRMYEELILPRQQRLFAGIHAAGGRVRLHICGNITRLLPALARLGADLVDCDWMVDLPTARRALGPRTVLVGNLDPVSAVMQSTPERIRAEVLGLYAKLGNPYMVGAGCEIPAATPAENLKALCTPVPWRAG
jgi:MtaA/CmuA family methyltransferase